MSFLLFWTLVIAILTAVSCSLAGTMLVVKREAFVSEGLSHAVLPGILFAFLIFQDRSSPWLILSAGLSGLLMVWLVQAVVRTGRVHQDAALGIVFSGMFSVGVIASSLKLEKVHFHPNCIIDGNLAFAAITPFQWGDWYLGPKAFVAMGVCLVVLLVFIIAFYKELKLMAFDESTAFMQGFRPKLLHTVWLTLVSIIAVAAFETAGTILVVALMIAPPAAANLLAQRLSRIFIFGAILSAVAAAAGILVSQQMDIAPAGPIASISGFLFLLVAMFAPGKGLFSQWTTRQRRRKRFHQLMMEAQESSS